MSVEPEVSTPTPTLATRDQYLATLARYAATWGYGLSAADYLIREHEIIRPLAFSEAMQCWVLAPSNDPTTLDFYCSLELRPVPVRVSTNGAPASAASAFVINKLFTPEEHRKKGYAKMLLEHVHRVAKGGGAVLTLLHSDVGHFYARFGWHIPRSSTNLDTTWMVPTFSSPRPTPLDDCRPLSLADLRVVLPMDVALLSNSLSSSSQTHFFLEPTFASHEASIQRALFDAGRIGRPAPPVWGLDSGARGDATVWSLLTYTIDFARSTLRILRWRSARDGAPGQEEALLRSVVEVARTYGVDKVVAWSVEPRVIEGLSKKWRGTTEARVFPLGAVAWYGEGAEEGKTLEWNVNEAYGSY